MADISFRPARAGEGGILFDITEAAVRARAAGFYSPAQIAGWMAGRDAAAYEAVIAQGAVRVAVRCQKILGFVDSLPGVVTRLYVRPEAMGQNLGGRLLAMGVAAARENHDGPVRLEAALHAVGFYARHGFVEVSRAMFADPPGRLPVEVVIMEYSAPG